MAQGLTYFCPAWGPPKNTYGALLFSSELQYLFPDFALPALRDALLAVNVNKFSNSVGMKVMNPWIRNACAVCMTIRAENVGFEMRV